MPNLTVVNPLRGVPSVLSEQEQILMGRCGYILGFLLKSDVKTGGEALMQLLKLRNLAGTEDIHTACVADSLAAGLQQWEKQFLPARPTRQRQIKKGPVEKTGKVIALKSRKRREV